MCTIYVYRVGRRVTGAISGATVRLYLAGRDPAAPARSCRDFDGSAPEPLAEDLISKVARAS